MQKNDADFFDLVIIGAGPAGLSAGLYSMRAVLKTVVVEKGVPGGQLAISKEVENYPGFEDITGFELADKLLHHAQSYGLEILQQEVVSIEPGESAHSILLANGRVLRAHALIIATGGTPRKLGIPGENEYLGRGVSYCAKCDGFFFKNKVVTVVGGGDTAVEEALYLRKLASRVYLVHRRDTFRASKILQERLARTDIVTVLDSVPAKISAGPDGVSAITVRSLLTGQEREIATEGVFVFIGLDPNNQTVPPGIELDRAGYAVAGETGATSIPGIFIAGDLRQKYAKQIVVAAAEGCTSALAAAQYVDEKKDRERL
jgi:thioredoxin reductase (NADPH)